MSSRHANPPNPPDPSPHQYRAVTKATTDPDAHTKPGVAAVAERVKIEAVIRECDLLQALGRAAEAEPCWAVATGRFPALAAPHNELGNLHGRAGRCVCFGVLFAFVCVSLRLSPHLDTPPTHELNWSACITPPRPPFSLSHPLT